MKKILLSTIFMVMFFSVHASYFEKTRVSDKFNNDILATPMGEIRSASPIRIAGGIFNDATLDSNYWTASTGTGGSATVSGGQLTLSTGTTANNTTSVTSSSLARYVGSHANRYRGSIQADSGIANNTRKWGAFTSTDGAYFQISGTTFSIVTLNNGSATPINSGSFNGDVTSYSLDSNLHRYEINYTSSQVDFIIDGVRIHTVNANTAPWTSVMHLTVRIENNNSNSSTTNVSIVARACTIARLGPVITQPKSIYQSGTTAGVVAKYGPGSLHKIVISGIVTTAVVTIYDNTSATGTILWSSGSMTLGTQANNFPYYIDFESLPFINGMTLVISTANCNVTLIYE